MMETIKTLPAFYLTADLTKVLLNLLISLWGDHLKSKSLVTLSVGVKILFKPNFDHPLMITIMSEPHPFSIPLRSTSKH